MKIRTFIIDDDPFIRHELKNELQSRHGQDIDIIGVYDNPEEALFALKKEQPELIFLDIQMPQMTGFDLLDSLGEISFEVIFITSFNQYAIEAIKHSALDYLLKPIDVQELSKAIDRFKQKSERTVSNMRLANLKHNMNALDENKLQLVIPTKQGEHQFLAQDIIRCEADSNYTVIYLTSRKKFVASKTLGDIEEMLSREKFIRIHKSHLVNTAHIKQLSSQDELLMSDDTRIPISRRRLQEVKNVVRRLN
jgi:two-component system, LytTR family, response regulator